MLELKLYWIRFKMDLKRKKKRMLKEELLKIEKELLSLKTKEARVALILGDNRFLK